MPVNHYFQGGQGIGNQAEKTLYEDLISEGLKIYGHDVYYLPRTLVNRDLILGEDTSSRFDDSYMIEMYFETTEGFAGQKELINKFGLEIREDTTFVISKRSWQQQVDNPMTQIVEGLKIYGHDVYYLPRTLVNRDLILGEDTSSKFDDSYMIEMYFETTEGFAGQRELINKFGLEIREDTTFVIAKRSWQNQVENPATQIVEGRPNEGDIIYFPLMNSFFEIQFVEDQEPFFQLGNLPVYKLRVTRWEYSSEELNTGIAEIDDKETQYSLNLLLNKFTLENESGSLQLEQDQSSGQPNFFLNEEATTTTTVATQSTYAQNLDLDTEAGFDTGSVTDDILDFTETNPFGEIN